MGKKTLILTEDQVKKVVDNLLAEQVYTDFDKMYDYKFAGNMWYTSRKGQNKWISLSKSPDAIKKLNARYNKSAPTGETTPKNIPPIPKPNPQAKVQPKTPPEEDNSWNLGDTISSWFSSARAGVSRFVRKLSPNVAQLFFTRPLTGEDFSKRQKGAVYNVIKNAVKRTNNPNRGVTAYIDYGEEIDETLNTKKGVSAQDALTKSVLNPYFQMASTLGQFTYQKQKDGTYKVVDTYDFHQWTKYPLTKEELEDMNYYEQVKYVMEKYDLTPYRAVRLIASIEHPDTAPEEEKVKITMNIDPKEFEQPATVDSGQLA